MRVVSTQGRILGAPQLAQLKDIVANHFVNPLIALQSRGTWEIVTFLQTTQEGHEKRPDTLMTMTATQGTDSSRKVRYLRSAFTALMQLGMASAFLFLLRGLLDVVAVAAGGGLDALNSVQAIARALYFSQTWAFLMSVSWGWFLGMLILPVLLALGLGAIPFARSWVRKMVIQALNPHNGAATTGTPVKNVSVNGAAAADTPVKNACKNGQQPQRSRSTQDQAGASGKQGASCQVAVGGTGTGVNTWLVGELSGYVLHQVFQKGRLVILGGLAVLSIVALFAMVIDLLSSHGVHLLFLLR